MSEGYDDKYNNVSCTPLVLHMPQAFSCELITGPTATHMGPQTSSLPQDTGRCCQS